MLQIITDSSSEISEQEAKKLGIQVIPLTVVFGGEAYLEGVELKKEDFYTRLLSGEFPHTAQPSPEQFREAFEKTNGEETLVLLISSALSGTTSSARLVKEQGNFTHVHIYETSCTTVMLRMLVETAIRHRSKPVAEVIKILDELRPRIKLYAYLDTLEYLSKGGRIKKSVAFVGGLLNIKPLITVTLDGNVGMDGKERGAKRAVKALADRFRADEIDPSYPVYFLQSDSELPPRELMKELNRETNKIFQICCAVGTHIGPNAAGIVYVMK